MEKIRIKLIEKRKIWFLVSIAVVVLGLAFGTSKYLKQQNPLNFGIDFTGGSTFLIAFKDNQIASMNKIDLIKEIRSNLKKNNIDKSTIQITDQNLVSIKTNFMHTEERTALFKNLGESIGKIELLEADIIGPSIGEELKKQAIWMILAVSLVLLIYITIRFEFYYGIAALIALLHDVLIVISFAILTQSEINTAFVAAILTILGYSINDTIVVFDRVRENLSIYKKEKFTNILNLSIQQTLKRSIHTSLTTLIVCFSLLLFGGITIKSFATILFIGFLSGTYSSIFIASPVLFISNKNLQTAE